MIEYYINQYNKDCTKKGQFPILYNSSIIFLFIFLIGFKITYIILNLLNLITFLEWYVIYIWLITTLFTEITILTVIDIIAFHKIKKKLKKCDNIDKNILQEKWLLTFLIDGSKTERIYFEIQFKNMLNRNNICSKKQIKIILKQLNNYIQQNRFYNFKIYAFLGAIAIPALLPIYSYIQNIYIPNTSSVFNISNLLSYCFIIIAILGFLILSKTIFEKTMNEIHDYKVKNLYNFQAKLQDYLDENF